MYCSWSTFSVFVRKNISKVIWSVARFLCDRWASRNGIRRDSNICIEVWWDADIVEVWRIVRKDDDEEEVTPWD